MTLVYSSISLRLPPKGSKQRKLWLMMIYAAPGPKIAISNLNYLCQLHFKPEDVRRKSQTGPTFYKLREHAIPLPFKTPIQVPDT